MPTYTKQTWTNGSAGGTPLSAARLQHIEDGLEAVGALADAAATPSAVTAAIASVVGAAPAALDTLKELADAINDDASFAASVTTALAAKASTTYVDDADADLQGQIDDIVAAGGTALTIKDEGVALAGAATSIDFVGAGVSVSGTTGAKTVTIPGSTGSVPDWVSSHPDNPPGTANADDDEFATGASLDTAGTRFSGATPWTWMGTTFTHAVENGSFVATPATTSTLLGPTQPLPTSGSWERRAKITYGGSNTNDGNTSAFLLILRESATGKIMSLGPSFAGGNQRVQRANWNSASSFSGDAVLKYMTIINVPLYYKIVASGTQYSFYVSANGRNWLLLDTVNYTSFFTTKADQFGFAAFRQTGNHGEFSTIDWIRRVA